MACETSSALLARIFILTILLAVARQALAGRGITKEDAKNADVKQPEWLISDHSMLLPGIGRVMLPPAFGITPQTPYTGSTGGAPYTGSTGGVGAGTGGNNIPGGDDTLVPNPGSGVPSPGNGGAHP